MTTITFDTLKFVKKLEAAGIAPVQAEALSDAVRDTYDSAELATKSDLRELELRIDSRFEKVLGEMTLLKWMMGVIIALSIANFAKQFF